MRWKPNPGHCPEEAVGKRVRVKLANGRIGKTDDNPMTPDGWAADGKGGCNWRITGSPFDIANYVVL
jgi:hypothetical protein